MKYVRGDFSNFCESLSGRVVVARPSPQSMEKFQAVKEDLASIKSPEYAAWKQSSEHPPAYDFLSTGVTSGGPQPAPTIWEERSR